MSKIVDLIGQKFGKLTVIKRAENNKRGNTQWLCKCDCGNKKIALGYDLTHGRTTTCGCGCKGQISKKRIDITGNRYGKLTVLSLDKEKSSDGKLIWLCKCDCGNLISVSGGNLKTGHTKSCGCLNEHANNFIDLTGQRFGRLVAIEVVKGTKPLKWLCRCDCGNDAEVSGYNLRKGRTISCGCYKKEVASKVIKNSPKSTIRHKTHGMSFSRLYREWTSMKRRCTKSYHGRKNYYDKGITVCDEWIHSFEVFQEWALKNGYDDKLTLDRKDNDKGYSPENCRWVDMKSQENNRTDNVNITRDGRTQTLKQWCEELGLNYGMVKRRRKVGWSDDRLFEPKHKNQYQ